MRTTLQCIKCGHRRLWVIDRIEQPVFGYATTVPLPVATAVKPGSHGEASCHSHGAFQAIICAQCGYTEWYAYQLERLHEMLADPRSGVRLVSSEPGSAGPFR